MRKHNGGLEFSRTFDSFQKIERLIFPIEDGDATGDSDGTGGSSSGGHCSSRTPIVFVIVFSAPANRERRSAIRSTWGSNKGSIVRTKFLIGIEGLTEEAAKHLRDERDADGDILLDRYVDSYENLTLKAISMLVRMNRTFDRRCSSRRFLLKADDDTFLNIEEVVKLASGLGQVSVAVGSLISGAEAAAVPDPSWREDDEDLSVYPDYLSGSAYLLSSRAVREMAKVVRRTKPFWLEDVYVTGVVAGRAGVTLVNDDNFRPFSPRFDPCSRQISCHRVGPQKMKHLQGVLANTDKYCRRVENGGLY